MFRRLIAGTAPALLAGFVLAASTAAASGPAFVPARNSPIKVAGTPVGVRSYDQSGSEEGLVVLNRSPGSFQVFQNGDRTPLTPMKKFLIKGDPLSLHMAPSSYYQEHSMAVVKSGGDFSFYRLANSSKKGLSLADEGGVGLDTGFTSDVVSFQESFPDSAPFGRVKIAALDRKSDSLILVSRASGFPEAIEATIPVGDEPIALSAKDSLSLLVVNKGSNDVSLVSYFQDPDENGEIGQGYYGHWEVVDTEPVGNQPVAITRINSTYGNDLFAVADSGSDQVTLLAYEGAGLVNLGTVPVGDRPVALTQATLGNGEGNHWRLAVANSGSDDVTIIRGSFDGAFSVEDTVQAGESPTAIASGDFDDYFDSDLAVANRASRRVSILLDNEPSGTCRNGAAKLLRGGIYADSLFGTANPDQILGLSGDDLLHGGKGGFDCLFGGNGKDTMDGYTLGDVLAGGRGADLLTGGSGADLVKGGPGNDFLCENLEEDLNQEACGFPYDSYSSYGRIGYPDRDRLLGGPGNDRIQADYGRDLIAGGPGRDRIFSRDDARDRVRCGSGRDVVLADPVDRVSGCEIVKRAKLPTKKPLRR